jgi:hypothetical protein
VIARIDLHAMIEMIVAVDMTIVMKDIIAMIDLAMTMETGETDRSIIPLSLLPTTVEIKCI